MTDQPPAGDGETLRFEQTLRPSRFVLLSLKLGLLNLITLTLYRFWSKTEVRRRVWRAVRLNGDAFEYTGRGVELFIGFLMALVALGLPFLALVFAVQFLGPAWALLYLPMYIFVFWLWGFGLFTAFRYLASRTTWRGIRFRLRGSARSYGLAFLGYTVLTGLTGGWFRPVADRRLAQMVWNEMKFGNRAFHFNMSRAEAVGVYGRYALGWFGTLGVYVLLMAGVLALLFFIGVNTEGEPGPREAMMMQFAPLIALALSSPLLAVVWAPYQAGILRSIAAGVGFDDARFSLKVRTGPVAWLTISNVFLIVFSFGLLMPYVQARTASFLVRRLTSEGRIDFGEVRQAVHGPRSGEGLADAFGFSAI